MELFKGYVPTDGKSSIMKFKDDTPLPTWEEVQKYPSYAGVLIDGVVLVDFDIKGEGERMLEIVKDLGLRCRSYKTTKGFHFYFKNEGRIKKGGTRENVACGLRPDFKVGGRNSYAVLRLDGIDREIVYDSDGDYDVIPSFLLPVKKNDVDFMNLGVGDGRNSELFRHILRLLNAGISKEESKDIIRLMNRHILNSPLDEDELNVIIRDEAFPDIEGGGEFFSGKTFSHNLFGDHLIEKENIVRIDSQLHVYSDGVYVEGKRKISQAARTEIPSLKSNQIKETIGYIDDMCKDVAELAPPRYIAFGNGIFDVETGNLQDFSPDIIIKNKIKWNYNPSAYSEIADRTLNKLAVNDPEIRSLLEECIGYCFYRANPINVAFFLSGSGSNGKSVFFKMLINLLGAENKVSISLQKLSDKFSTALLYGKLANIGADISSKFIEGEGVAVFKNLTSGDSINAEYKNENPFDFIPYAKLLFSANEMPKMKDANFALQRRMKMIPFDATFSADDEDFDPEIEDKLKTQEVMEYLINIGVEGLRRTLRNKRFTESDRVNRTLKEYMMEVNSIEAFLGEIPVSEIENQMTEQVYSRYEVYCLENELERKSKKMLSIGIRKKHGLKSSVTRIDGKSIRIYIR